mmetsp:Transcript_75046/g.160790  ORF Transcript_75046/g.160790 Transcript_75046/m.160790 type:complete len:250 (+) Transcript_75046:354-1103(+)
MPHFPLKTSSRPLQLRCNLDALCEVLQRLAPVELFGAPELRLPRRQPAQAGGGRSTAGPSQLQVPSRRHHLEGAIYSPQGPGPREGGFRGGAQEAVQAALELHLGRDAVQEGIAELPHEGIHHEIRHDIRAKDPPPALGEKVRGLHSCATQVKLHGRRCLATLRWPPSHLGHGRSHLGVHLLAPLPGLHVLHTAGRLGVELPNDPIEGPVCRLAGKAAPFRRGVQARQVLAHAAGDPGSLLQEVSPVLP